MTEAQIREKAVKRLETEGWVVWWPPKTRSFASKDIFTVFDLVCHHPGYMLSRYIQLTDQSNHAKRRDKVQAFLRDKDLQMWAEVWSWHPKAGTFRTEEVGP